MVEVQAARTRIVQRGEPERTLALHVGADPDRPLTLQQALRLECLARAGQPISNDQVRRAGLQAVQRDLEIAACLGNVVAQRGHLGADERPVQDGETKNRQPFVLAGVVEPSIQEAEGEVTPAVRQKVHHDKRDVVDDVDPAQGRVEFDAVERDHALVRSHQIAQVEVPMALAHLSLFRPGGPSRGKQSGLGQDPGMKLAPLLRCRKVADALQGCNGALQTRCRACELAGSVGAGRLEMERSQQGG